MKTSHIFIQCILFLFHSFVQGQKGDLPSDAPLRVGVKYRPETCPRKTTKGDKVSMHYVGTLRKDGSTFDSTRGNTHLTFELGTGRVIKGWEQGLLNMCEGEKRKLTIPSDLGYGDHGNPPTIPGGATLVFEVELVKILNPSDEL